MFSITLGTVLSIVSCLSKLELSAYVICLAIFAYTVYLSSSAISSVFILNLYSYADNFSTKSSTVLCVFKFFKYIVGFSFKGFIPPSITLFKSAIPSKYIFPEIVLNFIFLTFPKRLTLFFPSTAFITRLIGYTFLVCLSTKENTAPKFVPDFAFNLISPVNIFTSKSRFPSFSSKLYCNLFLSIPT